MDPTKPRGRAPRTVRRLSRIRRDERGVAFVEFAIIMPILMCMVLGIFTGGIAYNRKISLTGAAREGARYGSTLDSKDPTWATDVQSDVLGQGAGELSASQVCVALVQGLGSSPTVVSGGQYVQNPFNPGQPCMSPDNSTDVNERVQVLVKSTAKIQAFYLSVNVPLSSSFVALYEQVIPVAP